jgi:hypothetical protein
MATNDAIVLKANFEDWKQRATDLGNIDPWLYYCVDQFLKPYAVDDDDLESGLKEGGNDGGVDGHYFIVNHRQPINADTNIDPKIVGKIQLLFLQVKTSGGMKPTEIEKWLPMVDDFFDLSKSPDAFGARYNKKMKTAMGVWRDQFLKMSTHFPEVTVDFYYITGDDAKPDSYSGN